MNDLDTSWFENKSDNECMIQIPMVMIFSIVCFTLMSMLMVIMKVDDVIPYIQPLCISETILEEDEDDNYSIYESPIFEYHRQYGNDDDDDEVYEYVRVGHDNMYEMSFPRFDMSMSNSRQSPIHYRRNIRRHRNISVCEGEEDDMIELETIDPSSLKYYENNFDIE